MGPSARLAALLSPGERVLDADSGSGLASLWRCWPEVERGWLLVRTRRGLHVWQRDRAGAGESAGEVFPGDVKVRGLVVWPDDRNRLVVSQEEVRAWLSRRSGTSAG
jgi:hypothetical protein